MNAQVVQVQSCGCSVRTAPPQLADQIDAFYRLRTSCPVLRLTIPDALVDEHRLFTKAEPDSAYHCSVPFLAYRRTCLPDFTASLHRFAVADDNARRDVTGQYLADLRETWILENDEISRFRKARNYLSRLAELDFARWLELQGWKISNLEMYGGASDVEAVSQNRVAASFEIKFLAQREVLFELNRVSFTSPTAGWLGGYSPVDYLLFRVHEAACKLRSANATRIAVAIVSDYDVSYRIPLSENWIDWQRPAFLKKDSEIHAFLTAQYKNNENLDDDLTSSIAGLSEVWILRYQNSFQLHREHRFEVARS